MLAALGALVIIAGAPRLGRLYALLGGLLLLVHPMAPFVVAWHALYVAIADRARARALGLGLLGAAVIASPWVAWYVGQVRRYREEPWYAPPSHDAFGWLWPLLWGDAPGLGALVLVAIAVAIARDADGRLTAWVTSAAAALVVAPQAASYAIVPLLRDRNVAPLLVAASVAAGCGVAALPRPAAWGLGGLLVAAAGTATVRLHHDLPRGEQWREVAAAVAAGRAPEDVVWGNHAPLWRHYLDGVEALPAPEARAAALDAARTRGGRVWIVLGHDTDPGPLPEARLVAEASLRGARWWLLDPSAVAVRLEADPALADGGGGVHFWWNAVARSAPLALSGRCRVGVLGRTDVAGEELARLELRLVTADGVGRSVVELPADFTEVWGEAVDVGGEATIEVAFVNDTPPGAAEDRNAHVRTTWLRCAR